MTMAATPKTPDTRAQTSLLTTTKTEWFLGSVAAQQGETLSDDTTHTCTWVGLHIFWRLVRNWRML